MFKALTELAERMSKIKTPPTFYVNMEDYHTACNDLMKAQRIIAELAKVQVADGMPRRVAPRANCLEYSFGNEPPKTVGIFTTEHFPKWICSALNAVGNCRAIAEEGSKDGK